MSVFFPTSLETSPRTFCSAKKPPRLRFENALEQQTEKRRTIVEEVEAQLTRAMNAEQDAILRGDDLGEFKEKLGTRSVTFEIQYPRAGKAALKAAARDIGYWVREGMGRISDFCKVEVSRPQKPLEPLLVETQQPDSPSVETDEMGRTLYTVRRNITISYRGLTTT